MPDGVLVQGPDGKQYQFPQGTDKNAAIAYFKKKGIGAPGIISRASQVVTGETPSELLQGTKAEIADPKKALSDFWQGTKGIATGLATAAAHPIDTAVKMSGGPEFSQDIANKNYRGAVGDVLGGAANIVPALVAGKEPLATAATKVGELPRASVREFLGIGDDDLKALEAKHNADIAKADEKYQQDLADAKTKHGVDTQKIADANAKAKLDHEADVSKIKQTYSKKIADYRKAAKEASAKETAAQTKRDTLTKKSGPVYQKITGMADDAQKMVQDTNATIKKSFNKRYADWRAKLPTDAAIDGEKAQQAVQTAEKDILKGSAENIAVFRNIMKEGNILGDASVFRNAGKLAGSDIKDVMQSSKLNPAEQAKLLRNLQSQGIELPAETTGVPQAGAKIPLDDAMGYSSELGDKLYNRSELQPDVYHALKYVRDHIDSQVMDLAKAAKTEGQYRALKSDYSDYKDAFYDHDSPLYKLRYAADPGDKLRPIVGDEGARAIKLLGQFKEHGASPADLGRIRKLYSQVKDLPAPGGKAPAAPARPAIPGAPTEKPAPSFTPPVPPTSTPFSPEQTRLAEIQKTQQGLRTPSRWEYRTGGPLSPLAWYRMAIKRILDQKAVQDWLAGTGGGGAVPSGNQQPNP